MTEMTINFKPKNPTTFIHPTHVKINTREATANFPIGKEVRPIRMWKKVTLSLSATCLAAWNQTAYATTALSTDEQQVLDDLDGILFKIQLACGFICVSVAVLMAMVAGFFRMLGLREEAKKRYMDAIAGMLMVLTAPVVLGLIATIARGFIRLLPHYGS